MLKIKTLKKHFWKITFIAIFIFFAIPSATSASTIFRAPSVDGLVGYWDLNDGAGSSVAKDKSGQGYNGTLTLMDPATDWVDGKVGSGALDFDGSNDYVDMGDIDAIEGVSEFTFSAWVKFRTQASTEGIFSKADTTDVSFLVYPGGGQISGFVRNGENSFGYTASIIANDVWYHVVMVFNGNGATNPDKLKIYVDSINKSLTFNATLPTLTPSNNGIFKLGLYGGAAYDGLIDDVRVYNRALSAEEIQLLYDLGNLKP